MDKPEFFIGFIIAAAGADITIMFSKVPFWIGLIIFMIGIIIILHSLNLFSLEYFKKNLINIFYAKKESDSNSISRRIIKQFTLDGRVLWLFYPISILIIIFVIIYNLYYSTNKELGTYDFILILLASGFFIYPIIWKRFPKEADFLFLFVIILSIEVLPADFILESDSSFVNSAFGNIYIQYMVIAPVVALLNISGIIASSSGSIIDFSMQNGGHGSVGIAISCSGIYSAMIFIAAFVAYIISFYRKWERRLGILLIIGILAAYFANILRIYLVLVAGYFNGYGSPSDPAPFTLLWTHQYAGEIIFVCWIALFWWLAFRYFSPRETNANLSEKSKEYGAS